MFLHIGLNTVLDVKDIVAVINIESGGNTSLNEFINKESASVVGREPKSLIITSDGKRNAAYLSHISSMTLKKRIG